MKAKEIMMHIVKNLGNYETCRLEATYTLDKGDDVTEAMKAARAELESAYEIMYAKPQPKKERPTLTMESPELKRCETALIDGRVTIEGLQEYFILSKEVIDAFNNLTIRKDE